MDRLKKFSEDHSEHINQLPKLKSACKEINSLRLGLNLNSKKNNLKFKINRLHAAYISSAIQEFNEAIIRSLENGQYSVVESLSRIAVEHAVNVIYVASGDENLRAKSLLKEAFK